MPTRIFQKGKDKTLCKVGSGITLAPLGSGEDLWDFSNGILHIGDSFLVANTDQDSSVELVSQSHLSEVSLWKKDKVGRIYLTLPDGSKRYLWFLSKVPYVTPDALLATQFEFEDSQEKHTEEVHQNWYLWILLIAVLLGVGLWLMTRK